MLVVYISVLHSTTPISNISITLYINHPNTTYITTIHHINK